MYAVQLTDMAGRRDQVVEELHKRGIDAKVYFYPPIHMQACYMSNNFRCSTTGMGVTEAVAERVISLPMYPNLSGEELEYMADSLVESIKGVL